ncbi:zf-HC2 domain-containing protein [Massilia sp. W12]|uniref:zf-HC2 domain-containing protein n=1 Tax=Massilia sp. W12 TaxID=3126507 RepID=UPI0030D29955
MKYRILLTCQQAQELVSQGMDRKLHLHEQTRLRMHLSICAACRTFSSQMQLLRGAMQRWPDMMQAQVKAEPNDE